MLLETEEQMRKAIPEKWWTKERGQESFLLTGEDFLIIHIIYNGQCAIMIKELSVQLLFLFLNVLQVAHPLITWTYMDLIYHYTY